MTQYGYEPLSPEYSGSTLLARVNGVVPALLTNHKGAARPAYVQPGMMWIDDSGATWLLNLFDGNSDITIASVNPATHAMVDLYVLPTRRIKVGSGLSVDGIVGNEATPAFGDLSADRLIRLNFPGVVDFFAGQAPPDGWLECNGAAISRTTYANLFAAIGTSWGAGDGATTFNIPDLRGEFIRGWDHGRGVDGGRAFASIQLSDNLSHAHTVTSNVVNGDYGFQYAGSFTGVAWTGSTHTSGGTGWLGTSASGGSESRPRSVALLPIIKY